MAKTRYNLKTMNKEMHHIMEQAHELVDATSGELDERIKSARAALKERMESVKSEYGELEDHFLDVVKATDELMHLKPYYAIGGTLIAGLLLGWFMAKK